MSTVARPSPRTSILLECSRRGRDEVVGGCRAILRGGEVDPTLLIALAGASASAVLAGAEGGLDGYWPRVWAARGLLHVWSDEATDAIVDATSHPAWRVREMAAKVIARHYVADALDQVIELTHDENHGVRAAAERALRRLDDLV